jgi:hypothetical protein
MTDEAVWKKRFALFALVRLSGLAIIGLGLAVAFSDLWTRGGWRIGGALLIVLGTLELAFVPLLLKKAWDKK